LPRLVTSDFGITQAYNLRLWTQVVLALKAKYQAAVDNATIKKRKSDYEEICSMCRSLSDTYSKVRVGLRD